MLFEVCGELVCIYGVCVMVVLLWWFCLCCSVGVCVFVDDEVCWVVVVECMCVLCVVGWLVLIGCEFVDVLL